MRYISMDDHLYTISFNIFLFCTIHTLYVYCYQRESVLFSLQAFRLREISVFPPFSILLCFPPTTLLTYDCFCLFVVIFLNKERSQRVPPANTRVFCNWISIENAD